MRKIFYGIVAIVAGFFLWVNYQNPPEFLLALLPQRITMPVGAPAFAGSSEQLKATQILAALDEPLPPGKNVIWCAAFACAWKSIQLDQFKAPIALSENPEQACLLNLADDYRRFLDGDELYAASGWTSQGIIETIRKGVADRFPRSPAPQLLSPGADALIAYAHLEANVPFTFPYVQSNLPMHFKDTAGQTTKVRGFGLGSEEENKYGSQRKQARVLFTAPHGKPASEFILGEEREGMEFAVDPCAVSSPNQMVLARIDRGRTLSEMVKRVEILIAQAPNRDRQLWQTDHLEIPDIYWKLTHHFKKLEGRTVLNPAAKGLPLAVAQQELEFRLDRNGTVLRSTAAMAVFACSTQYCFDRPFLLYIKKRGAKAPFFVMWVDNAELLTPWMEK